MAELTAEQIQATDGMSLADIKALALAEAAAASNPQSQQQQTTDKPRDEQGKFVKAKDQIDNSHEVVADDENEEEDAEPSTTIYRREIDLGDGSGVQRFEAESLEELVDKLADAQRHATKKIRELTAERKQATQKTEQQVKDENYVLEQKFKTNPAEAMKEAARLALIEEKQSEARSTEAQTRFVNTHKDYVADPDNGQRLSAEVQRLGYTEFTNESLEKAYQSLKASGLLKLKDAEASDATEDEAKDAQRIAEPKVEATQQRSSKTGSNISTRTSTRSTPVVKKGPTEDELYDRSKYTTAQIREMAEKAMREEAQRQ